MCRWTKDILGMTVHEAGGRATSQESFGQIVKKAMFRKRPGTQRTVK